MYPMSVYVDSLRSYPKTRRWPYGQACHLFADTVVELHQFAAAMGLKRAWFQDHALVAHYDLTPFMRGLAIRRGAVPVEAREAVRIWTETRNRKENPHAERN
jgi:hypothetical protein